VKLESASGFTLESSYIVSSHFIRSNDVTKERVTEEVEHFLETMREVLCAHALAPEERLEELIVFLCKSLDGKMYFLDLPLAKVSIHKNSPSMQRRCLTPARVSALMHELEASARLKSKFLPSLNLSDMSEQSHRLYELHLHSASLEPDHVDTSRVKTFSEELASQRLTEVSCQFDSLVRESQELKKEFGIVMKVQLTKYPKDLLDHVIRHVYENILKDPRLSKYYLDKSRIYQKLVFAVKAVFMCGLSRNIRARMRTVHMGMGITDYDFDLYLKYFAEAMRQMNVEEEDVEHTADFLNSFRPDVVQRLLNEPST
jgi:truncated hemoglobin YjbI